MQRVLSDVIRNISLPVQEDNGASSNNASPRDALVEQPLAYAAPARHALLGNIEHRDGTYPRKCPLRKPDLAEAFRDFHINRQLREFIRGLHDPVLDTERKRDNHKVDARRAHH